jgi:hypothetical protein
VSVTEATTSARPGRLPASFEDLDDLLEWSLPTEQERYQKRMASTMEELQVVYDRILPRAGAARDYLDTCDIDALSPEAQRLLWLLFSFITVSYAVEVFGTPRVPDTASAYVRRRSEPTSTPA